MEQVCVYFQGHHIYNLEDMSLLDSLPNKRQKTLYKHLEAIGRNYEIKLAVMDFNQPLRNTVYAVFPEVAITINPADVKAMIMSYLGDDLGLMNVQEEIAVSVEGQILTNREWEISYPDIYNHTTKQAAICDYEQWQSYIPLGVKCFHHVIRIIDFYHQEVFNYFEFKNMLGIINQKR